MNQHKVFIGMPLAGHAHAIVTKNASESIGVNILSMSLHENNISNFCMSNAPVDDIMDKIDKYSPDYVGLSVTWINLSSCIEISNYAKNNNPDVRIIWGGPGVSFDSEHLLMSVEAVDVIVIGEGHDTIVELLQADDWSDLNSINGIAYRFQDKIIKTSKRPGISHLIDMPLPNRDELRRSIAEHNTDTARIIASWGCPYSCTFCINDQWTELCRPSGTPKRITRSVSMVAEEILSLYKMGIRNIIFVDEDAIGIAKVDHDRVLSLIHELELLDLEEMTYSIFTTTKAIITYPKLFRAFSNIGLKKIFMGIENVSDTGLSTLGGHIKTSIDDLDFLYDYMKELQVCPTSGFILLTPFTEEEEVFENIEYFKEVESIDVSAFASFFFRKVELYPGTKLYDKYISYGYTYSSPLDYEFINPKIKIISEILDRAWKRSFPIEVNLHLAKEKYYNNEYSVEQEYEYSRLINSLSELNISFIEGLFRKSIGKYDFTKEIDSYCNEISKIFCKNSLIPNEASVWTIP